ncbi:MAG: hypothetical protein H0X43_07555 [Nitrosospira sp.]|nr:hypothetical protein [Nitrosospira sp.]
MPNLPNRRTCWLTIANIVLLAFSFKWVFPEASVADIPLVIAFIAWGAATLIDVLMSKCFRPKRAPDHANQS